MLAKSNKQYRAKLDVVGMGVSVACAVHCVLLPVFFTTVPVLGIEVLNNIFVETATIVLSAAVGSWALLRAYSKYHRELKPLAIFVAGMGFLITANFYAGAIEVILKIIAITSVITAHVLNWRYSKACGNPAHMHP